MTSEHFPVKEPEEFLEPRSLSTALAKGMRCKCPSCGETKLFTSGLKVQDKCDVCHEEFHHHRADDLPAYLNIFIVGHIMVALTIVVMDMKIFGLWQLVALSTVATVSVAFLLMRPLKGMVVAAQWALRMHGFGGNDD